MSALADALVAAQSRAVAALGKQYVGGTIDADTVRADLESVGLTDEVDVSRLIAAWDTRFLRFWRSASEPGSKGWHAALWLGRVHIGYHVYRHDGRSSDRWVFQPWLTYDGPVKA